MEKRTFKVGDYVSFHSRRGSGTVGIIEAIYPGVARKSGRRAMMAQITVRHTNTRYMKFHEPLYKLRLVEL